MTRIVQLDRLADPLCLSIEWLLFAASNFKSHYSLALFKIQPLRGLLKLDWPAYGLHAACLTAHYNFKFHDQTFIRLCVCVHCHEQVCMLYWSRV